MVHKKSRSSKCDDSHSIRGAYLQEKEEEKKVNMKIRSDIYAYVGIWYLQLAKPICRLYICYTSYKEAIARHP